MDDAVDELRLQVEELRASRARLNAAANAERRQIERDLHDGPQQHLVALAVSLQLARKQLDSDPAAARSLLDQIGRDVREALEEVRALAQTVYPPLLLERGLADALRAAAASASIATRVEAAAIERYPPDLEATAYFCCLEALEQAAEHAGPGARATVRVWEEDNILYFEVAANGAGSVASANLTHARDRLGAVGGFLAISSKSGGGVCVTGTIPLVP